jgi:Trk K+ transport system NAD-binding subunit
VNSVVFLTLRRLRAPLLILIGVYAVGIAGLVLIPGVDEAGRPSPMSFFHAFYFLTYTASTIGFGEIPRAFTDAQRLWVTVVIYLSVLGWAYTLTALLALVRDTAFRSAVTTSAFRRRVRRAAEPFYIVCGYGETGSLVCRALDALDIAFVILDIDPLRVDEIELHTHRNDIAALTADARLPDNLLGAGVASSNCRGVLALTNDEAANLAVAITVKLLNADIPVLCRATRSDIEANMASFATDHVINPFRLFGEYLWDALHAPALHVLTQRLTGLPGEPLTTESPPPHGRWIVCGYGRFGREVVDSFLRQGLSATIIDPDPPASDDHRFVRGYGTDAATLEQAGVADVVGIVAGTDDDINNLSIAMTARALNPRIFVVMRQNLQANRALFEAFAAQITMVSAEIIADECVALISTPLLARFLRIAEQQDETWASEVNARLEEATGGVTPSVWAVRIDTVHSPAIVRTLADGEHMTLRQLRLHPSDRERPLDCIALLLLRSGEAIPLPDETMRLQRMDAVLFAGTAQARSLQSLTARHSNVCDYISRGVETPDGWVWRLFSRARARESESAKAAP